MKNSTKKITLSAIFSALALISFLIESLFPPLFIPGARMGISNIFILLALLVIDVKYAYVALIIKCVLGSLFIGNFSAVIYSLPSNLIALTIEILLLYFVKNLSIVSISVLGATVSTLIQTLIFSLVSNAVEYLIYLPYLVLIAIISGAIIGLTVHFIIKNKLFIKVLGDLS